jgi:hypothetical protein
MRSKENLICEKLYPLTYYFHEIRIKKILFIPQSEQYHKNILQPLVLPSFS